MRYHVFFFFKCNESLVYGTLNYYNYSKFFAKFFKCDTNNLWDLAIAGLILSNLKFYVTCYYMNC